MKIYDISWPITPDMTAYKDRHVVAFNHTKTFDHDGARESVITLGSHSGTHIDAPSHFLSDGAPIESYSLDRYVGPAYVIDLLHLDSGITADDLKKHELPSQSIILFKTANSLLSPTESFTKDFVYLDQSGAQYIADIKPKAVGIDYLGIERSQPGHETHNALLSNNIPIIEGLRLGEVSAGYYTLVCLPLAIIGLEAAPARAILMQE